MAKVKLFGNLRNYAVSPQVDIPGTDIAAILESLCETNPGLNDALLEDGKIRPYYRIMINGRDIELADGIHTQVNEIDQIAIFPPIAGGQQ